MQSFHHWQQSPEQGAIPNPSPLLPADEAFLVETLVECRLKLESALKTAQGYSQLPDLTKGLADAITGIHQAAAVVLEPETYLD